MSHAAVYQPRTIDSGRSSRRRGFAIAGALLRAGAMLRATCGPRRSSRRDFSPGLLALEGRALLSGGFEPSPDEQFMLALLNQARANPAAEGQRLLAIAQSDPLIRASVAGSNLGAFLQQIDSSGPLPPLAFNTRLIEAARDHDAAMVAVNNQSHSPAGYLTNAAVARSYDGQAFYPTGAGVWATGENVYAYSRALNGSPTTAFDTYFHEAFLLDWGNPAFGHLKNAMAPGPGEAVSGGHMPYSEVGIGLQFGASPTAPPGTPGLNVGPALVSEEFGYNSGLAILTGAVFRDSNRDQFYAPGEGLGGVTIQAVGQQGQGTFQVQTWASGGYSLPLPPGSYVVTATGNVSSPRSTVVSIGRDNVEWDVADAPLPPEPDIPVPGDYDGIGVSEIAVYRPSTGQWFINSPVTGPRVVAFGLPNVDIPVPADYDGDGKVDLAVFRPTTGQWFILGSRSGYSVTQFGMAGDVPVPRDYDGVGRADLALFRPSTGQWVVIHSSGVPSVLQFGAPGDIPLPADYDGVGRADIGLYRPGTGQWFILGSKYGPRVIPFGLPGDVPVPRDYDGIGRTEVAVFRPSTDQWWILSPGFALRVQQFGVANQDVPVPTNLIGPGQDDLVAYIPTTGVWEVTNSRTAFLAQFGLGGSTPSPAPYLTPSLGTTAAPAAKEESGLGPPTPTPRPLVPAADPVALATVAPGSSSRHRAPTPAGSPRAWDHFRRRKARPGLVPLRHD